MMLQATLVTDGSSDRVLLGVLRWLIGQMVSTPVELRWADLRGVPGVPSALADRIRLAIELYPCQLLFVHRDAERRPPDERYQEIAAAVASYPQPHVCVVPVRMQEAWLLHDEAALRRAAGSPTGTQALNLPPARRWEQLPDPKSVLYEALRTASGLTGRRAKTFRPQVHAHRLAELVEDWSALRGLAAFQRLEQDTRAALLELGLLRITSGSG